MKKGWINTTLDSLAEVAAGQAAPQGAELFGTDGHPFVRAGSLEFLVRGGREDELEHIGADVAEAHRLRLFPADTVVFAKSGMSATKGLIYRLKQPCYVVSHLAALSPRASLVPEYLTRWLETHPPTALISNSAYPSIRLSQVAGVNIQLPEDVDEQRRIAAILGKADAIRRKRRAAIRLLDEFLRSAFLDMFGDPLGNAREWPTTTLGSLVMAGDRINYGVVQPGDHVEGGVPIVRVGDFKDGHVDKSQIKRISPHIEKAYERSRLLGDEVLIACVGSIGEIALADLSLKGANIVRAVARVRLRADIQREFVAHYLRTAFAQGFFRSETRTVSQPTLNIKQIIETPIYLPPNELRQRFADVCAKQSDLLLKNRKALCESDLSFRAMSQAAFKGEL